MHLLDAGGHLRLAAAVDDVHRLRPEALGAARRIHRHVAAADDRDRPPHLHGRVRLWKAVRLHEVDAREELVGRIHAVEVLARNALEARQPRAGADKYGVVPLVAEQLVERNAPADDHVRLNFDAHILKRADLAPHEALGQTELRYAVHEHAAGRVQRLEHRHIVSQFPEVARAGQSGRAAADDGDAPAVWRRLRRGRDAMRHGMVRHEPLETADADRLALDAAHAFGLALRFLRADAATDGGQSVGGAHDLIRFEEPALLHERQKLRNAHIDRAAGHTGAVFAVQATLRLLDGHRLVIPLGDLVKVFIADVRRLLARRQLFRVHVGHQSAPPRCFCSSILCRLQA